MTLVLQLIRRPKVAALIFVSFVLLFSFGTFHDAQSWNRPHPFQKPSPQRAWEADAKQRALLKEQGEFWRTFHELVLTHDPQVDPPQRLDHADLDIFFERSRSRERPDLLEMSDEDVNEMQSRHSGFVRDLKLRKLGLNYLAGTQGVVTTAGGRYLPVFVISLRMLRRTGSKLPIEVFLADYEEYNVDICDNLLPSLNARCVVLSDIFAASGASTPIGHYQFKIMSMLFSSFEDVLFLDSDAFPVHKPEELFKSEPFISTGMVIWPDFWYPSESRHYFRIANIPEPPLDERASTESGEMLYSKKKHGASLLLAAYYNYYGPKYYYPLQSQGAPGEGDKETFPWAATALGEKFYNVRKGVSAIGHFKSNGDFQGSAMVQYDPVRDFEVSQEKPGSRGGLSNIQPMFVHANFPKFDPASIFKENAMGASGPTRDDNGSFQRVWHDETGGIEFFGYDLEKRFWEEIKWTACELEHNFTSWLEATNVCADAISYWEAVFPETPG